MTKRRSKTNTALFKDVQDNERKVKHKKVIKTNKYGFYVKMAETEARYNEHLSELY